MDKHSELAILAQPRIVPYPGQTRRFELAVSRYGRLVEDSLATNSELVVALTGSALPATVTSPESRTDAPSNLVVLNPSVYAPRVIGCRGPIIRYKTFGDDELAIDVAFKHRVRIDTLSQAFPYWRGVVERLEDQWIDRSLSEFLYDKILDHCAELLGSQFTVFLSALPHRSNKSQRLSRLIGEVLIWLDAPLELSQQLLEENVLERRAVLLADWLRTQLIRRLDADAVDDSPIDNVISVDFSLKRTSDDNS